MRPLKADWSFAVAVVRAAAILLAGAAVVTIGIVEVASWWFAP